MLLHDFCVNKLATLLGEQLCDEIIRSASEDARDSLSSILTRDRALEEPRTVQLERRRVTESKATSCADKAMSVALKKSSGQAAVPCDSEDVESSSWSARVPPRCLPSEVSRKMGWFGAPLVQELLVSELLQTAAGSTQASRVPAVSTPLGPQPVPGKARRMRLDSSGTVLTELGIPSGMAPSLPEGVRRTLPKLGSRRII